MAPAFYMSVEAEQYDVIDKITVDLSFSPKKAIAGETIDVFMVITNTSNETVTISKSSHTYSWKDVLAEQKTIDIQPKNSELLIYKLYVPNDVSSGTYVINFQLRDSHENIKTVQKELEITGFALPVNLDFAPVLALLAVYYIPAQFIERMLELLKLTKPQEPNNIDKIFRSSFNKILQKMNALEEEISFFREIRKKISDKKIQTFEDGYEPGFDKEDVKRWVTEELQIKHELKVAGISTTKPEEISKKLKDIPFDNLYLHHLKQVDAIIASKSTILSKLAGEQATLIWIFSLAMAIIPAVLFAVYGIGLLQVLWISGHNVMYVDIIINTLFIGSGTKPIHDIMNRISAKPN